MVTRQIVLDLPMASGCTLGEYVDNLVELLRRSASAYVAQEKAQMWVDEVVHNGIMSSERAAKVVALAMSVFDDEQ